MARVERVSKGSGLAEALAAGPRAGCGWGWEQGDRDGRSDRPAAPVTPVPVSAPGAAVVAAVARRLRDEASASLGGRPVAVRVSAATVRWKGTPRGGVSFVGSATLHSGPVPAAAVWSRTVFLAGDPDRGPTRGVGWPPGWLAAASRAIADACALSPKTRADAASAAGEVHRTVRRAPDFGAPAGLFVVDALAAGDLLRLGAPRDGHPERVPGLARGVSLHDRGSSRLGAPPASWRAAADPPWQELVLEVARREPWPEDAFVLTRLVPLRGVLLAAGHRRRRGNRVDGWGPAPIPSPMWWLARVDAALGEPVADATGPPVACPPLLIAWGRSGARR